MSEIRCRIAPSPSGFLHIGTAKMALFNWLFARKHGGTFILRLEDTDVERTDEAFVAGMLEGFHWLGITWDEGPAFGDVPQKGDYGPYRQSERKHLYKEAVQQLLDAGKAYKDFTSKEELDALRTEAEQAKQPFVNPWRDAPEHKIAAMGDAPAVVRFRVPEGVTELDDLVQGKVRVHSREVEDFVIQRANGEPIFHMAVVVDDAMMKISHVIRGDDHLTNAMRHVMLFEALGYPLPKFAHLPMVLDENGKKFSKRLHGANVLDWRDDGYLPEALINYVALLGWTPEEENRELFTIDELLEAFTIDRWGKSPARFDRKKLDWLNGQHIRMMDEAKLGKMCVNYLQGRGYDVTGKSGQWLAEMVSVCKERLPTINHIEELTDYFFKDVEEYEEKAVRKQWRKEGARERLLQVRETVAATEPWTFEEFKANFSRMAEENGSGLGPYIHPTRLALTGKSVGPGLFELAALLGREECLRRLDKAVAYIDAMPAEQA